MNKLTVVVGFLIAASALTANSVRAETLEDKRPMLLLDAKDVVDGRSEKSDNVNLESLAEQIEGVIAQVGYYRIVSKKSIGRSAQEQEIFAALNDEVAGLDNFKTPAYRLSMVVKQYKSTVNRAAADARHAVVQSSEVVDFAIKVTDMKTGELLISKDFCEKADRAEPCTLLLMDQVASAREKGRASRLQAVVTKAFAEFSRELKASIAFRIVDCSDDGILTIDASKELVTAGEILDVYSLGKTVVNARTGKKSRSETKVATVRIVDAKEDLATAEFDEIENAECDWHVVLRKRK